MSANILHKIESGLGVQNHVPVIDPNTQKPETEKEISVEDAAVPAILAGLYKKTRSIEGATELITGKGGSIFDILFGDQKSNVVKSVADYANTTEENSLAVMQNVADLARDYVVKDLKHESPNALVNFFTDQRNYILTHLPPGINMGEFLNDPTLDDRTNKMEGPMSGLMHTIEKVFSSSK